MKKYVITFFVVLFASIVSINAQELILNGESGKIGIDIGNCWTFEGITYSKSNQAISGNCSFRSNKLTSETYSSSWIKTPWMKFTSQKITFKAKLDGGSAITRKISLYYIPYNKDNFMGEGDEVLFYDYYFVGYSTTTKIQNFSINIPEEMVNSTNAYKIMVYFSGYGGNGRIISDDFVFPGSSISDSSHDCLPIKPIIDKDNDGVEDTNDKYPNDPNRAYDSEFPSTNKSGTLAFEDSWPKQGDYDFNDIVIDYKLKAISNAKNQIVDIVGLFTLKASGANYQNGFGFQLDGVQSNKISSITGCSVDASNSAYKIAPNGLEMGQPYATCIVFDNFFNLMPISKAGGGIGVNTDKNGTYVPPVTLTVKISLIENGVIPSGGAVYLKDVSPDIFNFFIVANNNRNYEIHLTDKAPTALANQSIFGTEDDTSSPSLGRYYKTKNNLPWGINIVSGYKHTIEEISINKAYHYFVKWATSSGSLYNDWYNDSKEYREPKYIY